jgi:hypothetical protein
MLRRSLAVSAIVLALSAARAEAVSVRDIIELSKAGLGDAVLLALIEVDRSVFNVDLATLKKLKEAGVSDVVIVAMIRSGRETVPAEPPPAPEPPPQHEPAPPPPPQVVVIDHREAAPQPVAYPVAVPVYVPVATGLYDGRLRHDNTVKATISTDQGIVRARVPVPLGCVKAEPVYWGFGGKLRPGSWEPAPVVVCR